MLWEADSDGLYCWDYDRGRPTSQPKMQACELDGFPGVDPRFNITLGEWSFSTGAYSGAQLAYLEGLRFLRAYFARVLLVGLLTHTLTLTLTLTRTRTRTRTRTLTLTSGSTPRTSSRAARAPRTPPHGRQSRRPTASSCR